MPQAPCPSLTEFRRFILTDTLDNEAIAFAELKNYPQALRYFDKSNSLNPKDVDALYNKGNVLDHMGNFTGTLSAYIHAQNLTPHNKDVLFNEGLTLGIVMYQWSNYSMAVKVYDMLLEKAAPTMDHQAYLLEMRDLNLYWKKGLQSESWTPTHPANYTAAQDYFNKILQITPKDSEALNDEGLALSHLGDHKAINFFDLSLTLDPSNYDTLWNKAYSLLEWGDYKSAVPTFTKILKLNKTDSAANDDEGIALFNLNNKMAHVKG